MDITWYGHNCFRITERGQITIITDPFDESLGLPTPKIKGDVVTISQDDPAFNHVAMVRGNPHTISGPGEYELSNVFIYGVALHTITENDARRNVGYRVQYNGLTVLHLGNLGQVPNQATIQDMGEVNVLLVPVGGALRATQAAEVVSLIEPHYIVPMQYDLPGIRFELDTLDKFLTAMGVSKVQEENLLRVSSSTLPEQPQVVVLHPNIELED